MRQSSLGQLLASSDELLRRRSTYAPDPAQVEQVKALVALVDGVRTQSEIADALHAAHAGLFPDGRSALAWVTRRLASLAEGEDA